MYNLILSTCLVLQSSPLLPTVVLDRDNVEITESCIAQIRATPIVDEDNNGVIHITRDGITIDFNNQRLHGARADQTPDAFAGLGVKITAKNVTLKNVKVSGYKVGIHAINADGLTIFDSDVSNNFHQRLKSTPEAEDGSDWLWPHNNDDNEWITNYGAGICVEDSSNVTLHDIRARKTQNGIILDRVNDSKMYDCNCSFLSGWGLAMWRSNRNVISRNAFDFCVRGYSHGVYNRGQDSAGILMFEQCSENIIAQNSATHGGDGLFAFAGRQALGEVDPQDEPSWYARRGNNGNLITMNDLSYAAAHGLELTFSFDNRITLNRFAGNAICGIWGGYSQNLAIGQNIFQDNGDADYGLERGGINIEHGRNNLVLFNSFIRNACGIHLWWDDDNNLHNIPWAKANLVNKAPAAIIRENTFNEDKVALHLRGLDRPVIAALNQFQAIPEEFRVEGPNTVIDDPEPFRMIEQATAKDGSILGNNEPLGARLHIAGRENIIMTEWGPWDHEMPLLRFDKWFDHAHEYTLLGAEKTPSAEAIRAEGNVELEVHNDVIRVRPKLRDTLVPYAISVAINGERADAKGMLSTGTWEVWTFKSACDPREDAERWRREGLADHHTLTADALDFRFGSGGMSQARGLPVPLPTDHFGVVATRSLTIPSGKWRIKTTSDDGIRVWMDDQLVIDDWTWHGPTKHDYEFEIKEPGEHKFRVEYFELDGHAVLSLDFEQQD